MNNAVKDQLRRLISSMTKSEKRNFKLFATRVGSNADSKFVQLFDLIDGQDEANDEELLHTIAGGNSSKLSNLKRHLYQQVLISLRLLHINKQTDIQIRQQIDFARILYGKGHFLDALRLLERIRSVARDNNYNLLLLEILEFQKMIEARHVTNSRQVKNRMDQLVRDSREQSEINLHTSFQSNVNIQIQGYYILNGHARSPEQREAFDQFWKASRSPAAIYPAVAETFFERVNRYQASMWRHYIKLDLDDALEDAGSAYNLFKVEAEMPIHDPDLYVRLIYYLNAFAFLTGDTPTVSRSRRSIDHFIDTTGRGFNDNSKIVAFVYQQLCELNDYIVQEDWEAAHRKGKELKRHHGSTFRQLPDHRVNLFRYKLAAVDVARKDYEGAQDRILKIMNSQINLLREDLLINTRMLQIICYVELEELSAADYAVTNLSRIIRRNKFAGEVHRLTLTALRQLLREGLTEKAAIYDRLQEQLEVVANIPYEAKCLRFLDLRLWLKTASR